MDDLYDVNFQSNDKFCKICIRHSSIQDLCSVKDLNDLCLIELVCLAISTN
jgi:hypothetical protein